MIDPGGTAISGKAGNSAAFHGWRRSSPACRVEPVICHGEANMCNRAWPSSSRPPGLIDVGVRALAVRVGNIEIPLSGCRAQRMKGNSPAGVKGPGSRFRGVRDRANPGRGGPGHVICPGNRRIRHSEESRHRRVRVSDGPADSGGETEPRAGTLRTPAAKACPWPIKSPWSIESLSPGNKVTGCSIVGGSVWIPGIYDITSTGMGVIALANIPASVRRHRNACRVVSLCEIYHSTHL